MVVSTYWGHLYSGVAVATADKDKGIVDEETFDVEAIEDFVYGGTSSLDGSSSIQETKNFVGLVGVSNGSRS